MAYQALLAAVASGDPADFERIPLGGTRKLRNPLAGVAFDLEGPDSHHLTVRPVRGVPESPGEHHATEQGSSTKC